MPEITPDILAAADKVERDLGKLDVSTRALLTLVRHDQGGAPAFSPSDISGLALWLDADDASTITSSGGAVSAWTSKDANGRGFSQGTGGLQPTTGASTQNSRNVIDFAGDYITANAPASLGTWDFLHDGSEYAVFAVVKFGVVANPDTLYPLLGTWGGLADNGVLLRYDDRSSASRNDAILHGVTNDNATLTFAVLNVAQNLFAPQAFGILTVLADPNNATAADRSSISKNGAAGAANNASTGTPSANNPPYTLDIGAEGNGTSPTTGAIAELLVYDAALTSTQVDSVESYLATKWGITL